MTSGLGPGDSLAASIQTSIKADRGKKVQSTFGVRPLLTLPRERGGGLALANKHTLSLSDRLVTLGKLVPTPVRLQFAFIMPVWGKAVLCCMYATWII